MENKRLYMSNKLSFHEYHPSSPYDTIGKDRSCAKSPDPDIVEYHSTDIDNTIIDDDNDINFYEKAGWHLANNLSIIINSQKEQRTESNNYARIYGT